MNYESETTTRLVLDSLRRLPRSLKKSENLLSARCVIRGLSELHLKNLKMELVERLGGAVRWKTTALHLYANPQALKSTPSSRISMMMNWKRITKVFRDIHQQARQKYASRMFLHWRLGACFSKKSEGGVWGGRKLIISEDVKHVIEISVLVCPVKTLGGGWNYLPFQNCFGWLKKFPT